MEQQPRDEPRLYNSRITNTYLRLIKCKYDYIDVNELLRYAGMEPYQVEDEGHWFTQTQINRFHERLRQLTGNKSIAREAGIYSASPEALSGISRYLLGLVTPASAYALVGKYTNKFTRSSQYESRKLGPNQVEILVTPREGVKEEPFQCENRQGYIESISKLFNYKLPRIEHPQCLFKGDPVCRYIVWWQKSPSAVWKRVRDALVPVSGVAVLLTSFFISHWFALTVSLPASASLVLLFTWYCTVLDNRELNSAVETLKDSSDELIEQINVNYESALMVNEIGQALSKQLELDGVLAKVVRVLKKRLDYDRGLVLLANAEKTRLYYRAGYGYTDEQLYLLKRIIFHLDNPESKGVFVVTFRNQQPMLLNDINEVKDELSARSLEFARKMGAQSFICCPIVFEDESLGILAVDNVKTKRPLLQRDINLLLGVANQIGISIHNARLIEGRLRQFESILHVLAATTDARDPITAGHSLKVTEYAVGMCHELGLEVSYCEMIRVASLLHDYGKIGVEDSILKKPGRLSSEEYIAIQTHAEKTRSILEKIDFEGIYQEVPPIAGAHHEKMDGTGYPEGLKGDNIPLGARIIAVADVFEALTSKRHYRDPMPVNEAFDHLVDNIDIHFDSRCVQALINYYNTHEAKIPYLYQAGTGGEPAGGAANRWQRLFREDEYLERDTPRDTPVGAIVDSADYSKRN